MLGMTKVVKSRSRRNFFIALKKNGRGQICATFWASAELSEMIETMLLEYKVDYVSEGFLYDADGKIAWPKEK